MCVCFCVCVCVFVCVCVLLTCGVYLPTGLCACVLKRVARGPACRRPVRPSAGAAVPCAPLCVCVVRVYGAGHADGTSVGDACVSAPNVQIPTRALALVSDFRLLLGRPSGLLGRLDLRRAA